MRTVFVTGAAHGMGLAAARAFASDGDRIFLYDRDETRLPEAVASVAAEERPSAASVTCDRARTYAPRWTRAKPSSGQSMSA